MKKKAFSRTRNFFKRVFKIKQWADWERMKGFTLYVGRGIKRLFVPGKTKDAQGFDQMQEKFNLSSQELLSRQKGLFRLSILMVCIAIGFLCYAVYLLAMGHVASFFLSFVLTLLALVLAFRYNYWHFLIKHKRLNTTIKEWFRQGILGEKHE